MVSAAYLGDLDVTFEAVLEADRPVTPYVFCVHVVGCRTEALRRL